MVILTGENLGARQQELNMSVKEALKSNVSLELKHDVHGSDVDNIFNIDLACKQKNLNYVLQIFKSGDEFAITRALNKATWLCDKEFAQNIHANFFAQNIFPVMSIKMKKKFLTEISFYLKDQGRIIEFYDLCIKENLDNIAIKFLNVSSEAHQSDEIGVHKLMPGKEKYIKYLIGNSMTLADNYLKSLTQPMERNIALWALRYMYPISGVNYLQLLETYYNQEFSNVPENIKFGLRVSKSIIKNHKERIMANPTLYMNILNPNIILKNCTRNEANFYAVSVLPTDVESFWIMNYCKTYKHILKLVDENERFSFVKKLFNEKYPDEEFEMHINFYKLKWCDIIMTEKEKEDWACQHLASGKQLLGIENDYIWYQFVHFEKALDKIHNYISATTEIDQKTEMLNILVDRAKTPKDLEKLINFCNEHYSNLTRQVTESVLDRIIKEKHVLEINEDCWLALEKIFYRLKVFESNYDSNNVEYRVIALIYNIVNNKKLPDVLNECLDKGVINFQVLAKYSQQLNDQAGEAVYQYIYNYLSGKIKKISSDKINEYAAKKHEIYKNVHFMVDLMSNFNKNKDSISENLYKLIRLDWEKFKYHKLFVSKQELSEGKIRKYLKTNGAVIVKEFPKIKQYIENRFGKINWLIRKLRTYFSNDIAKIYLNNFETFCNSVNLSKTLATVAMRVIITLGDETKKNNFLQKYSPCNQALSSNGSVTKNILYIRQAICKQACYSRPPLPLATLTPFMTQDLFIPYCIPMLQHNVTNWPQPLCIEFLALMITDKPFVIQKHGIRLALDCLDIGSTIIFFSNIWKNVTYSSLRVILYQSFLHKFQNEDDAAQRELFESLKMFTEDLKEDDEDLFDLICKTQLPEIFIGDFLAASFQAVERLPEGDVNFQRATNIIRAIKQNAHSVSENFLDSFTSSHVNKMLNEKQILKINLYQNLDELLEVKWNLIAWNLTCVHTEPLMNKNLNTLKTIIALCIDMWHEVQDERYILREFCVNFLKAIEYNSYNGHYMIDYTNVNILLNAVIAQLDNSVPEWDIYILIWNLRLGVETRKILMEVPNETNEDLPERLPILIIECMLKLANVFGTLMKEYIQRNMYFSVFINELEMAVADRMLTLKKCLDRQDTMYVSHIDMHILMCTGLVEFEIPEMYLFICKTLPVEYSEMYAMEYKSVIKTVKSFPNKEIQFYLYEKFVNSNRFVNFIDTL